MLKVMKRWIKERSTITSLTLLATIAGGPVIGATVDQVLNGVAVLLTLDAVVPEKQ